MKLIIAIVNHDDASPVQQALTQGGYSSTKLATTGGFLRAGNATILIGVEEEKLEGALDIIRQKCHARRELAPTGADMSGGYFPASLMEVNVGGATVFVVDVERFEHI